MLIQRLRTAFSLYHTPNYQLTATATAAKSLQSCPTLSDPIDGSPPGSPVPGILQARTLEWVAISFPNAWKWKVKVKVKVKVKSLSPVWLLATPWTSAYQTPPSMGFFRQEYWSGVPLPSPNYHLKCMSKHTFLSPIQEVLIKVYKLYTCMKKVKKNFSCSVMSNYLKPNGL